MRLLIDHTTKLIHDVDSMQESCNEASTHEQEGQAERASSIQEDRLAWLRSETGGYADHEVCLPA